MDFLEVLKVILLGIVEGITEWLPVSSTGHMILLEKFWPLANAHEDFHDAFFYTIQLGAILAVVCLFFKKLFPFGTEKKEAQDGKMKTVVVAKKETFLLWAKVLVACLPALVPAVLELLFGIAIGEMPLIIAIALIVYGVAFIVVEYINKKKNRTFKVEDVHQITFAQAAIIGGAQLLAIVPGTSRSGITILAALLIGISRPAGAEFTFFLAVPVMVGASAIKILSALVGGYAFSGADIGYILIGCVVAFAVSLAVVKFLMNFVKKHDFAPFGWYRIALGAVIIVLIACNLIPAL